MIERSEIPVRSVELQLLRVETVGCAEGYSQECNQLALDNSILNILPIYSRSSKIYMFFVQQLKFRTLKSEQATFVTA